MTVKILDCSLRDGGHLNAWNFSREFGRGVYDALKKTGVEYVELGYRTTPGLMPEAGEFRYTSDELIREITELDRFTKTAIMIDAGKASADDFVDRNKSPVDLVRIAFYKQDVDEALNLSRQLTDKGYTTTLNLMGIVDCSDGEVEDALAGMSESPANILYVSDSYGSMVPSEVAEYVNWFKRSGKPVGLHPHNNQELAFANSLAAIEAGATYIDATINGMGRGAGNLRLETMFEHLNKTKKTKYGVGDILDCVEKVLPELRKQGIEWGPNPVHALTGSKGVHPKYGSELLKRGMGLKEIRLTLQRVHTNGQSGFDQTVLDKALD